ncbi:MAG: hypothetical protein HWD59_09690 [Coxiellaceae bacterium]|nr:MAG: hypothetical protein HWD59_09690 [Coxiellaceae bacterium]
MRIQLIRIWLVLLLSLLISSIALADEDAVNTNASTNEEAGNTATNNTSNEQLFVLTSKWATLKPVNTKKGIYRLVLHGIAPYVSYYSNTPDLNTGMLSTATFVSQWQKGLKSKEPSIHQGQAGVRLHGILNKNPSWHC